MPSHGILLLVISCCRVILCNFAENTEWCCAFVADSVLLNFWRLKHFLRPHLWLLDPFTATSRPLTATNFPRPPIFFYGHISGKWPSPRPSDTSESCRVADVYMGFKSIEETAVVQDKKVCSCCCCSICCCSWPQWARAHSVSNNVSPGARVGHGSGVTLRCELLLLWWRPRPSRPGSSDRSPSEWGGSRERPD